MFHVKHKFLNIMEKETTSVQFNDQLLELNCPENADTLLEVMNCDDKGVVYGQSVIMNTQDPFVGYSEENQYWFVQFGDTRVAINCKHNADLIAKILECDNDNTEF